MPTLIQGEPERLLEDGRSKLLAAFGPRGAGPQGRDRSGPDLARELSVDSELSFLKSRILFSKIRMCAIVFLLAR